MRGDQAAISPAAARGWALFRAPEVGCDRCHDGPDFDAPLEYYNIGLYDIDGAGAYPDSAQGLIEQTGRAQERERHIEGRYLYDHAVRRWLQDFLQLWVGPAHAQTLDARRAG